ncbi:MAG: hypothetical protein KTR26_03755 [Flammeovirgaceae bacterium]|nr:hypothetical protein [Flammeovirgaceae bacterium]
MDKFASVLKEFNKIIEQIGPTTTLIVFGIILIVAIVYKIYKDKQDDKYINKLLEEKERTIQRVADEARQYKFLYFKERGWTTEELEKLFIKNDFLNIKDAREKMENKPKQTKN